MASNEKDSPISLLETLSEIDGNLEYFAVAKDGTTYKCTPAQLKDFVLKGETPVVRIPLAVLNLSNSSSSEDILNAFGGKETFIALCEKIYGRDVVCVCQGFTSDDENMKTGYVTQAISCKHIDAENAILMFLINIDNVSHRLMINCVDGTASFSKTTMDDSISTARSVGYMMQLTEIDASGLDEDTWYPVTISAGERMNIRVEVLVSLDSGTKPSWSTHERGFSTRKIWEFASNAWGVNRDSNITIYLSDFVHADIDPVRGLGNLSQFDTCYVFVRGGGKYHFYASHSAYVILRTDTYKPSGGTQSVSPTTETPAEIVADIVKKKYVDDKHIMLTITDEAHIQLISNQEVKAGEAESKINLVFGSIDNFKNIIQRLLSDNILFLKITEKEIFKVSTSHTYCNPDNGAYELSFIYTYTSIADANNISLVTKRIFIALNSNATNFFVVKDILVSDNLTTLTKKTAAEYEALGSKDANTAYCVTD